MSGRDGSPIRFDVGMELDRRLETRDGVGLATDVYFPQLGAERVAGRFPVVVERTPYGKRRSFLVQSARYFARSSAV